MVASENTLQDEIGRVAAAGETPRLLLHCCCAPCASYVLEYLSPYFNITVLYFNPNIEPLDEYVKRGEELQKLLSAARYSNPVAVMECEYGNDSFKQAAEPFLDEPEGGRRCTVCFELRLGETARLASEGGYDYFATTLSVGPHKNAALLNEIGERMGESFGVRHLASDFKKKGGYQRSVELSKEYDLYRQVFCGCASSRRVWV